jgi:hypothetical protein
MDHLPLPADPINPFPKVPYVCGDNTPYDGGEWLTYPARIGWPQAVPSSQYPQFSKYELANPSDDRDLEKFFQKWIFFGLLHRVLGDHGLYDAENYILRDDEGKPLAVHTHKLVARLEEWQKTVKILAEAEKKKLYGELVVCLYRAEESIKVLRRFPSATVYGPERYHPQFNSALKLSLAAIGHVITCAIDNALLKPGETRSPNSWMQIGWDDAQEPLMLEHGWCPREVAIAQRDLVSLSAQAYLQRMKKPKLADHSECHVEHCPTTQFKSDTYETRHVVGECKCEFIGPELEDTLGCLKGPTYPLMRVTGTTIDEMAVKTEPFEKDKTPYVAFSHVWADGLGNAKDNRLPRCQWLCLRTLMQNLVGRTPWGADEPESRDLLLWCDTPCCPAIDKSNPTAEQQDGKTKALQKMREVYTDAAYVLVLDRSLQSYSYAEIGPLEAALRVFTSRWWRRIW